LSNDDEAPSRKDNVTAPIKTIQVWWYFNILHCCQSFVLQIIFGF
jgi:hypothetical protein